MQRDWNQVAETYDETVFDVLAHDEARLIASSIARYGKGCRTVTDIGCGIGKFIPLLAERFRRVEALDLSSKCLARAREANAQWGNVGYRVADLADPEVELPKSDLALCVNVLLTPSLTQRERMLDALCGHLRKRGRLILVVPSLESILLSNARLIEWNLRRGLSPAKAETAGFPDTGPGARRKLHAGVVQLDGVDTKHYLKEEVQVMLEARGMSLCDVQKIEYTWDTEFVDPPEWMQAPFPWDWLCVARRR